MGISHEGKYHVFIMANENTVLKPPLSQNWYDYFIQNQTLVMVPFLFGAIHE